MKFLLNERYIDVNFLTTFEEPRYNLSYYKQQYKRICMFNERHGNGYKILNDNIY